MPNLNDAAIAANRFGFGARPGELAQISGDPRGWVKAQFQLEAPLPAQIAALPAGEDDLLAFGRWLIARKAQNANQTRLAAQASMNAPMSDRDAAMVSVEQDFIQTFRARQAAAIDARLNAALASDTPARERAVHFWSNHFTISSLKAPAVALPQSFEREAIRPHVAGAFADMLLASSKHPGMLVYLDNWQSIGPHSQLAQEPRRYRRLQGLRTASGLNENLAREIMELHTLSVRGGYSQADVQALAALITGWSFNRPTLADFMSAEPATRSAAELFRFVDEAHEPGPKTLLSRVYHQGGVAEGEQALRDLAHHPSTAHFIATKLARHYIADDPPEPAVTRIAAAFTRHDGDLRATMNAVVDCDEVWADPFAKFKRPEEYVISVLRAGGVTDVPPGVGAGAIALMGEKVYAAPGPNGWSDSAEDWLTGDLVWKRIEFAQRLSQRLARADISPVDVGDAALGPLLSADTRQAVQRADSPAQGLAILFASPEFQRR